MKTVQIAAYALNAALYVAVGVLIYSVVPISFGGVRFWPQVIIPAVFAVVFGPWVGGLGAATGIFINDVVLGGSPILSLMAGITSNFLGFFLVGYIANKEFNHKNSTVAYGAITVLSALIAYAFASWLAVGVIIGCYAVYLVILWKGSKWVSYEIGSVVGLLVGSVIIGVMVPIYAVLFAPSSTAFPALTAAGVLGLFTWTFVTEIPFLLVLGPPILAAVQRAFPRLFNKQQSDSK